MRNVGVDFFFWDQGKGCMGEEFQWVLLFSSFLTLGAEARLDFLEMQKMLETIRESIGGCA